MEIGDPLVFEDSDSVQIRSILANEKKRRTCHPSLYSLGKKNSFTSSKKGLGPQIGAEESLNFRMVEAIAVDLILGEPTFLQYVV